MPSRTLVIIDMQDTFFGYETTLQEKTSLVAAIHRLIQYTIENEWPVILVEFSDCGDTIKPIREAIEGYPRQETVFKSHQDGGEAILNCIRSNPTWPLDLLVCGIFGHQCVAETVAGLLRDSNLVEVDVVIDAIHPLYCSLTEPDGYGQQREGEFSVSEVVGSEAVAQMENNSVS